MIRKEIKDFKNRLINYPEKFRYDDFRIMSNSAIDHEFGLWACSGFWFYSFSEMCGEELLLTFFEKLYLDKAVKKFLLRRNKKEKDTKKELRLKNEKELLNNIYNKLLS